MIFALYLVLDSGITSYIKNLSFLTFFLQQALLPDNFTVLDRAMIEHNLLSASKLYTNIRLIMCSILSPSPLFLFFSLFYFSFWLFYGSFEELGTLLGIPPHKVCDIFIILIVLWQNIINFLLMIFKLCSYCLRKNDP